MKSELLSLESIKMWKSMVFLSVMKYYIYIAVLINGRTSCAFVVEYKCWHNLVTILCILRKVYLRDSCIAVILLCIVADIYAKVTGTCACRF